MPRQYTITCLVALVAGVVAVEAAAQPLGTFRWQLQPYCNVVTFAVTQTGGVYTLDGYDDQCNAATRAPATGIATFNPGGTVEFGFHIVVTPGASPIHVAASIDAATLNGTWRDHTSASGSFVITAGAGTGGSPRPVATTAQWIPNLFALRPDGGFLAQGSIGSGTIPGAGAGTRLMWYPGRGAFRAGNVSGTQWDEPNIGQHSVAFGSSTVAAGQGSVAGGVATTAGGAGAAAFGLNTTASGVAAFAAGSGTTATSNYSFAAGTASTAGGPAAAALGNDTKAGGFASFAAGDGSIADGYAAVAIGDAARASGNGTVALGRNVIADAGTDGAVVLGTHAIAGNIGGSNVASGSFIFGDRSTDNDLLSLGRNEFLVRVAGGVRIFTSSNLLTGVTVPAGGGAWASVSDVHAKENFRAVDADSVLAGIARLPIREWNYKTQDAAIRHVGPTAQDFRAAFGLGEDDTRISTVDADGIALAAIQALEARSRAADDRARRLEDQVMELREQLAQLEAQLGGRR